MRAIIFPNRNKPKTEEALAKLSSILESRQCDIYIAESIEEAAVMYPGGCDMGIVLGGDGTMLSVAEWASGTGTPIIGINHGTLGYMHELEAGEIELIDRFFEGEYNTENRMMLHAEVIRNGEKVFTCEALNEIVVCRGVITKLIDLELFCGCVKAAGYRADGIIISTPTGSTAYSMSAGGPIVDPGLELITACAVCPHGVYGSNTMIFSPDSVIGIRVSSKYNGDIYLTSDGRNRTEIFFNDEVRIRRSAMVTRLIKLKEHTFCETLSRKFNEK
ncbi:MAG: NAD(+)/NADH kinase [Eubacteriales bacterium]|nr:NAD(+)/NADH kinase [Eubacteriales bacterium]